MALGTTATINTTTTTINATTIITSTSSISIIITTTATSTSSTTTTTTTYTANNDPHSPANINFYVPLTTIYGNNSIVLESSPGLENWHTLEGLTYGDIKRFHGSMCSHFTLGNDNNNTTTNSNTNTNAYIYH